MATALVQKQKDQEQPRQISAELMERVVVGGDLEKLSPAERLDYYGRVCESLGLNPLTRPFEYIKLNNKLTLYARRDATDQLRAKHSISIEITDRKETAGVFAVTARASMGPRADESIGAVAVKGLQGDALANAIMKAETKAKRRVTLSIVGLGWLDETETEAIPSASTISVDTETGEILGETISPDTQKYLSGLIKEAGIAPEAVIEFCEDHFGKSSSKELTAEEASELSDWLLELRDAETQE